MSLEMQAEKIECYTKSLSVLGPIIGKLDVLSMHINSNYGEDAILRNTTYSILNSLIELTGNKEYRKMNIEVKKNPVTPEIIKQANELRDIRLKKEVKVQNTITEEEYEESMKYYDELRKSRYKKLNVKPEQEALFDQYMLRNNFILEDEVKPQIIPDYSKSFVEFTPKSSNVKYVRYSTYTCDLYVTYHRDSKQYLYPKVSQDEMTGLVNAPSTGKYINQVIKPNHSYDEVTEKVGK